MIGKKCAFRGVLELTFFLTELRSATVPTSKTGKPELPVR